MMCALPMVYVHSWIPFLPHQSSFCQDGLLPLLLNFLVHDTCRLACILYDTVSPSLCGTAPRYVYVLWLGGWMNIASHPAPIPLTCHQYCTVTGRLVEAGCETWVNVWAILFLVCLCVHVRRWKWQSQTLHSSTEAYFKSLCSLPSDTSQLGVAVLLQLSATHHCPCARCSFTLPLMLEC